MNLKDVLKVMGGNKTQSEIAKGIGTTQGALATMLSRNNMQVATLYKIADSLGYDIVLRPRSGNDKKERTVVLDDLGIKEENKE